MESLKSIFQRLGCGKYDCHRLDVLYEQILEPRRQDPLSLLEIGIHKGRSLQAWREYLPHAEITAVDIDRTCEQFGGDRTTIFIGHQADRDFLKDVVTRTGPLDIAIDDGSHKQSDQQASFEVLWPHIKRGGVYVIEDLHSGYRPKYNRGQVMLTLDWLIGKYRQTVPHTKGRLAPYWFMFFQAHCAVVKTAG
jgi:hypothetical protein